MANLTELRLDDLIDRLVKMRTTLGNVKIMMDGLGEDIEIETIERGHIHVEDGIEPVCVFILQRGGSDEDPEESGGLAEAGE